MTSNSKTGTSPWPWEFRPQQLAGLVLEITSLLAPSGPSGQSGSLAGPSCSHLQAEGRGREDLWLLPFDSVTRQKLTGRPPVCSLSSSQKAPLAFHPLLTPRASPASEKTAAGGQQLPFTPPVPLPPAGLSAHSCHLLCLLWTNVPAATKSQTLPAHPTPPLLRYCQPCQPYWDVLQLPPQKPSFTPHFVLT